MATGNIVPESDITIQWTEPTSGTHYDDINEGPSTDANFIRALQINGDDGEIDYFNFTTLIDVDTVTQVKVWVNGYTNSSGYSPEIELYIGGWKGYQELSPLFTTTRGWCSYTWGSLSHTQAELNGLQVRIRADVTVSKSWQYVHTIYCEITYTPVVSGYGHDVIGVLAANIDEVCGVPTANIDNIIGV